MNRIVLAVCLCALSCTSLKVSGQVKTPASSPLSTLSQIVGLSEIKIDYSRPSIKSKRIFGEQVPYDQLWITGANSSTDITFSDDATIGGSPIKAGKYALFTIPGAKNWRIILYKDSEILGDPAKDFNEHLVAASFETKPILIEETEETMTIYMNNIKNESLDFVFRWENTMVTFPISFETNKKVELTIQDALANGGSADDHYKAAKYYLESGQNLATAHRWISKAVEMSESAYWMYSVKCQIEAKMGKKKMAKDSEKKFIELSEEARMFEASLPKSFN